jgi:hypothetical protein
MALRATPPLTKMSTRKLPGGKKRPARRADNLGLFPLSGVQEQESRTPDGGKSPYPPAIMCAIHHGQNPLKTTK